MEGYTRTNKLDKNLRAALPDGFDVEGKAGDFRGRGLRFKRFLCVVGVQELSEVTTSALKNCIFTFPYERQSTVHG